MAVAYASKTSYSGGFGGSAGTTIALPSGTTAGELLILFYCYQGSSSSNGIVGFDSDAGELPELHVNGEIEYADSGYLGSFFGGARYFFATANDVSAGTINIHGDDAYSITGYVELYRISGSTSGYLVTASYDVVTGTSPSFDNDVTGVSGSGIMLMMASTAVTSASATSASSYAIATNNPTWTEIIDASVDISAQRLGVHTAYSNTRTSTSSSGNSSISISSGGTTTTYCVLVSIGDPDNVTVTIDAPGVLTLSMPEPSLVLDNIFTIDAPGVLTLLAPSHTIATQENSIWTKATKPSDSTWTPTNK